MQGDGRNEERKLEKVSEGQMESSVRWGVGKRELKGIRDRAQERAQERAEEKDSRESPKESLLKESSRQRGSA